MNESKYFFRKIVYIEQEGKTALVINFDPIKSTVLEPWMSLIFLMADGMHTIEQLHQQLTKQYQGNVPSDYKRTIDSVISRLLKSEIIGLSDNSTQLPPYLMSPFDKQAQKDSMKMMLEDGYLKMGDLH